jgi:Transposase IS116/IS110/IS902 family
VSAAVVAWAGLLKQLIAAIAAYDQKIDILARAHPDYALIKSLPGAGPALAPRIIAALGSQRDRYETAYEIQCYSGIAPVVASSGKQRWVHRRWSCPKFLRQTFHEWALHSVPYSKWARDYYDELRAKGKRAATPSSAHWRSNGFAFSFVAGKIKSHTMKQLMNAHLWHATLSRNQWNSSGKRLPVSTRSSLRMLDGAPQMSILRTDHSSVEATLAGKHGKRCAPYLPKNIKMLGDIYRPVTFVREATRTAF